MSVSRRDFLALLGTSFAVAAAAGAVTGTGATSGSAAAATGASADQWVVAEVGAVSKGAVPISLRNAATGEVLLVEACRRGGAKAPVAQSKHLDLFLANNGQGSSQTPAAHVHAARALASHLDRTVAHVPATVLTQSARLDVHAELTQTNDDLLA
jgi:hypothetical protein